MDASDGDREELSKGGGAQQKDIVDTNHPLHTRSRHNCTDTLGSKRETCACNVVEFNFVISCYHCILVILAVSHVTLDNMTFVRNNLKLENGSYTKKYYLHYATIWTRS